MQLRKRSLMVTALTIALAFNAIPAYSASISGTTCTKAGSTKIVSSKKYTCIKSGKKLIWDKGVSLPVTAPQTSAAVQAQLGARMANIAAVQMVADRLWKNSQGLKVEDPTWKTGKNASFANVAIGAKAARQMTMSYSPMFPNFDMNELPTEPTISTDANFGKYIQGAHGVGHLAQTFYANTAGGIDPKQVPTWYSEGVAMVTGTMATAAYLKNSPNYATIVSKLNLDWKSDACKASYEKWRTSDVADDATTNTCAYGLGQIMVEYLVNKVDAADKMTLVLQMLAIGNPFSDALKYSFGVDKATLFAELDTYLKSLNW
jgi:hypothetical protein